MFQASPPIGLGDNATITLVEANTFCLSGSLGDIHPGTAQGLFYRDTRVISRWELRVEGQHAEHLTVLTPEAFTARFVLRVPPRPGLADSTLLLVRDRQIGEGLRETLTVHNLGHEDTALRLILHAEADFADILAVKQGRLHSGGAELSVAGTELHFTDHTDPGRGLIVSATGDPVALPGALSWRIVVPAHERWSAEVSAQPVVGHRRVQMSRTDHDGLGKRITAWRATATDLTATDPVLMHILRHTESDLGALRIDEGGGVPAYVAAGAPWVMTLYGRDSLLTSWMALPLDSALAVGTLRRLAKLQGTTVNPMTEEEPGRIIHEMRRGPACERTFGGNVYYGSADATPLFVMLLAECRRWGAPESVVTELLPAADAALDWIDHFGDCDRDGFVEYRRKTDLGLVNQGWKDSPDAIADIAGRPAEPPIALCEVQGYVYAARLAHAELALSRGDLYTAERLTRQAGELKQRFDQSFWVPERGWYALALDHRKRRVDALTSNVAHCLWTGIVPDERAAELIERLADPQLDTGFGLRTLSSEMGGYNPMSYHNGSVWPHDTALAVAGLMRYRHVPGACELAEHLAEGLIAAALHFHGRLPELFCGFGRDQFGAPVPFPTACSPQAWASAAPLLLIRSLLDLSPDVPSQTLHIAPQLPARWGRLRLTDLRLGSITIGIEAEGTTMRVDGLPADWVLNGRRPAEEELAPVEA
jgi:glycogen debranching enzyme